MVEEGKQISWTQEPWHYQQMCSLEAVRKQIKDCEGKHVQQATFSTFMNALTQICFTERVVRSSILWKGNRSANMEEENA